MTDFFADLEQEIRAAHPRRSRPVVPVRTLAVATSVLAAIAAVATFLPVGEREVAQQPPAPSVSAKVPVTCGPPPSDDAAVPDVLLRQFAVLRSGAPPATPLDINRTASVLAVYERGVRVVDAGDWGKIAIVPVSLPCAKGQGSPGMCTARLEPGARPHLGCAGGGRSWNRDFAMSGVYEVDGRVSEVIALASDSAVDRVEIGPQGSEGVERRLADNLVLARREPGEWNVRLREPAPSGCNGPDMAMLSKRFAIFRRPRPDVDKVRAYLSSFVTNGVIEEARIASFPRDVAFAVLPGCAGKVCLAHLRSEQNTCTGVPASADDAVVLQTVTPVDGELYSVAALVTDGVRKVTYRSDGGGGVTEAMTMEAQGSVVYAAIRTKRPESIEVVPAP